MKVFTIIICILVVLVVFFLMYGIITEIGITSDIEEEYKGHNPDCCMCYGTGLVEGDFICPCTFKK